jgi:anti-anti-sigma regulatory factor
MEFKIDTKTNYTLILPETPEINENMAEALRQKVKELTLQGNHSYIVDLTNCQSCSLAAGNILLDLHETVYNNAGSLVFTDLQDPVLQSMKKEQWHLSLNLTPTLIEAIDIVNMENIERDLLKES